jgi:putative phosphoribosyl transferase
MEKIVHINEGRVVMEGMLKVPEEAVGIVLFAHGSGSSRFSPRNNFVSDILNNEGLATLLIDLLSEEEDAVYQMRFNIDLLADRLGKVVGWLQKEKETKELFVGLFGSSTGAAAAMRLAAKMGTKIKAVVSRGGRPDLAMAVLHKVTAPTLLIVGGNDFGVIELNEEAFEALTHVKKLEIVPGATHLFEEPGCLDEVAKLAKMWFKLHLK